MIRIYHNNRCSKSRATLALLEQRSEPVEVINYLDHPPSPDELAELLQQLGMSARQLWRSGEAEYQTLHLDDPSLDDDALISAMVAHPKLIERPIVVATARQPSDARRNRYWTSFSARHDRCNLARRPRWRRRQAPLRGNDPAAVR